MLFNDDFLEEEYTSLPHYEGTEMLPVRGKKCVNRYLPSGQSRFRNRMTSFKCSAVGQWWRKMGCRRAQIVLSTSRGKSRVCFPLTDAFHCGR